MMAITRQTKKADSIVRQQRAPVFVSGATRPDAVTDDRIRARAYEIFETRRSNGGTGDTLSDWLRAERELKGPAPEPTVFNEIEIKAQGRGDRLLASDGK